MTERIEHGDCLEVMAWLRDEGVQVHSIVTDPPYHLTSIVKRFGKDGSNADRSPAHYRRAAAGFMGKQWDGGDIAMDPATWKLAYDLLLPGGHLVALCGARTEHRVACAIEDAGFEIRDRLLWLYGTGFPKSHDVSKAIDKAAGANRERIRGVRSGVVQSVYAQDAWSKEYKDSRLSDHPITDAAHEWQGWGTALKPAMELGVLARKPLSEKSVAANVLRHGTGAVNIDACRVAGRIGRPGNKADGAAPVRSVAMTGLKRNKGFSYRRRLDAGEITGRWPPNVLHDGSEDVTRQFPADNDAGTAARFFPAFPQSRVHYSGKADAEDRVESKHPTVKPVALMRWLVRLVTPPGGVVLDPFAGSGTTGQAAIEEGFGFILIEREDEYVADIRRRLSQQLQAGLAI